MPLGKGLVKTSIKLLKNSRKLCSRFAFFFHEGKALTSNAGKLFVEFLKSNVNGF